MLKYRTSIYTRPRAPLRPTYRKTTLLDLMRAERKVDAMHAAHDKIMADAILYGTGVGLTHLDHMRVFNFTQH